MITCSLQFNKKISLVSTRRNEIVVSSWTFPISQIFAFAGTKGKTSLISLEPYRTSPKDEYSVEAMDIGEVVTIHLHNDGASGWCYKKQDWFLNQIQVTSSNENDTFNFPFYGMIFSDVTVIHRGGNNEINQISFDMDT